MDKDTGGPAFPTTKPLEHWGEPNQGMTLRDYFAARAIQGLLSDPDWRRDMDFKDTAWTAYEQADAMLKVRGDA